MTVPDQTPDQKRLSDRQWRNLLSDIHDGQVIVVVGSELAVERGNPAQQTLYQRAAKELVQRLGLDDASLAPSYGLLAVSNLFLQNASNEVDDLYREARDVLGTLQWPTPEPLIQLTGITDLNLFVTTTIDATLERALNEVRFGGKKNTLVLTYSEKAQLQDLPVDFETRTHPTVFHLFGKLNPSGDFVLTEEKLLEFSHRLQSRDLRPPILFDLLKAKHLLILGCSLPGWLARFILRTTKGDQLLTQGARGSLVADRASAQDVDFAMFLERRKVWPYAEGDAVNFVRELHDRWREQYGEAARREEPAASQPEPFKSDSVFISYASEDYDVALQVFHALDSVGVDVWFDKQRLASGDSFRLVIEENIERCSYFVPLISRHSTQMDKRFFQREWKKAIDEAEAWPEGYPFIQPLLVDDVSLAAPGIPEAFRKCHARRLTDLSTFIDEARKRIQERRLRRRMG
jgi:hypothetical protein